MWFLGHPFTPFPVTASNVCGGTTLPSLRSPWFLWHWQYLPTTTIPGTVCVWPRLGTWSKASVSLVVGDGFNDRHITQGRQIRANQPPSVDLSGLLGVPMEADLNHGEMLAGARVAILPTCKVWAWSQQTEQRGVKCWTLTMLFLKSELSLGFSFAKTNRLPFSWIV